MADVNANIGVNIDTSDALNQLKNLQRQISQFHQSVAKSSSAAGIAQRDLQKNFINSVNSIQGFSAELRTVRTSAESFTNSLEKNKFSIQQYFRYAASQTKTFGKKFTSEFATIEKTAIERVKTLQTQYVKMGRNASGAMQAIAIRPTVLDMKNLGTQTAIAAQKQVLFNQLIKQGSTNLLNFGKNTQWAGRQLMVGFTLPLATLGMTAGRVFMEMETAALKFKKVYGDLFTAPGETEKALDSIMELGLAYTQYGVAVSDSLEVAADAAAAGFQGVDLQNQTTAALKLSVLGQMELQQALETTIALQSAFSISSQNLSEEIDFLNAVENQTVVSLDDITEATPRVATVIQSLGGDVRDLAFFLAAMKEGGVNAAQGANALKSGLASLINPAASATQFLGQLGIDLRGIVARNKDNISGTVVEFAKALDTLDPQRRAQAIEQLFGKFQFARMSALFENVIKDGSQASRVLDLAGASMGDLAELSEKELGTQAASAMNKFRASVEKLKVELAPVGEMFLKIATPFLDFATSALKAFNSLPDGMKQAIGTIITVVGGLGPILLMTFGLINNGIANMIKFFATVRLGYLKMTGQAKGIGDETQYMTQEQLEAATAAASLDQAHAGLTQRFTVEKAAVDALRVAYQQAADAGARFATLNPGMMRPGFVAAPTKMAKGGVVSVGGRGNKDTEPALLTPGEAVIPAPMVKQYAPLIEGMIAGNIPGYAQGVMLGMPKSSKSVSKNRDASEEVYQMFLKSSYAGTAPTNYGHQISPTSGHSFPIFGLGGVYQKGNKQVFVKPVLDEKAAIAEMRSNEISRMAHGLEAPEQRIVVIKDPMDVKGIRRFLALESDLDPKFVNNQPMGIFNEEQYFRQLVASLLRVDKDLSGSNVFGNVVADAGPAGVFNRASGIRDYDPNLPSMEDQALINLLGIRGGAKRAFAESTLGMMAGLTPEQYHQRMLGEIQKVLPRLKQTIASFKLTDPTEVGVYDDMIRRLEQALGVDWSKFHAIHSAVKPPKPKAPTQAAPLELANGIVSVPGPKGAGDVTPAMLSPGEAVIPTAMAKKYAPIIQAMIAGKIPGYKGGTSQKPLVPLEGSFEASHFGVEKAFIPIQDALNALKDSGRQNSAIYKNLEAAQKAGATQARAYTNEVVALSKELNQAMERGTKSAPIDLVRRDVAGPASADMHIELERQLRNAGLDESQIKERVDKLNVILQRKLDEFGDKAEVTSDELNKLISDGYEELAQTDKEVRAARAEMRKISTVKDPLSRDAGGKDRQALSRESYREQRKTSYADTATRGGFYGRHGSMQATPELAESVGLDGGRKLKAEIDKMSAQQQQELAELKQLADENAKKLKTGHRDYSEFAKKYQEFVLLNKNSVEQQIESAKQLDIVQQKRPAAKGTPTAPPAALAGQFNDEAALAAETNSESERTKRIARNTVDGYAEELKRGEQEVEQAAKQTTDTIVRTIRRASSDPAVQADIDRRNQQPTQARRDSANISARTPRQPRRVIREGDKEIREAQAGETNKNLENTNTSFIKLTNNASKVALGLSAMTGILSTFGGDLAGLNSGISMVTGAIFALITITQALQGTFIATAAAARASAIAQAMGAKTNAATGVASLGSLFTKGKGLAGLFKNLGTALKVGLRFLGPIGIALSVLAIAIPFVIKAFEDNANKINGLGAAANLTEEKLTFLAEKFNVTAKSINWAERGAALGASSGKSSEEQKQVVDLMIDPEFATEFNTEITGIKNATKEEAELALQSLAMQLSNSGFEDEAVSAIISAIAAKAGQTDLELNFKPILITDESTANQAAGLAKEAIDAFNKEVSDRQAVLDVGNDQRNANERAAGRLESDPITVAKSSVQQETKAAAGVAKSSIDSLTLAFESGNISADIYNQSLSDLFNSINSAERPDWMIQSLAEQMGLTDVVQGLTDAADKSLALQAAIAGIDAGEDLEIIREASKAANEDDTELQAKALTARQNITDAIEAQTIAQEGYNHEKMVGNVLEEDSIEAESVQASITAYHDLVAAGMDAELAYQLTGDAARVAAFKAAQATDAINGNTAAVDAFKLSTESLDALNKEREGLKPGGGGGGGQKSAFQEAMDQLKEQQKAAKDSITSYAKLRSAGMSVAESSEIAKDSMLAAALASERVGSSRWNQLVTAIRAARAEEAAWLNSTPEGRAEHFSEVYGKVMDVFSAQEAILEMNNESATAANRKIIEALEKQIEVYERRASELQRDLDKIAEKEDEINKAYDEKTKALEKVKKLNQDILNQQKSQLSIADALSQGDIGAAATAIQESRAQNAAAQGDAVGNALDASRQAQLNALTENGKTRAQIEAEIKQIKKDVADIEFGSLQNARDAVTAADEALEVANENLRVQGLSKTEWENINTRIDASKANAALYDAEVGKALLNAQGLVGEWSKLQDTFTTTHVVNTVYNGTPSTITPAAPAPAAPALDPETARQRAAVARQRAAEAAARAAATGTTTAPYKIRAGGYISGPGSATSDSIPAMLSNGEYVIKAASVNKFGKNFLDAINAGRLPGFKLGGMLRDGGGSSRSTPGKAVGRVSADAAERRAMAAKPSAPRATQLSSNDMIGQGMKFAMDQVYNTVLGPGINALTRKGDATQMSPLDWASLATMGLSTGMIGGASRIATLARTPKGIRGLKPDVPKTQAKLPDLSKFTPKLPPGMQALIDDMAMVHRSMDPYLVTKHPGQVAIYNGNAQGPGTYFYRTRKESLLKGWEYGGYQYQQRHNPLSALKTATSKGYLDFQEATFKMNAFVSGKRYDDQVIQDLIKQGYIGMKDPGTGVMTNFMVGTKGGPTLKKVGPEPGKLERFFSMFNPGSKFAAGGMVPKYFAAGGMVPKYFAAGGMVPKYFGDGGMAKKYAKGGDVVPSMLTPGEFVMNKNATAAYGPLLNSINSGSLSSLVGSGQLNKPVYNMPEKAYAPVGGSMPLNSQLNTASSLTAQDNSVYNYSLSVNVDGTNASPDQIANVVMKKLQSIDSQRVRRQVIR
jgi:TP901 family phage tail tape measure protein